MSEAAFEEAATDAATPAPIRALAEMLRTSSSTVVLTGAGISVPSGIPDFRTPGKGLWSRVDPMKVATIDAFHADPKRFWDFYRPRFSELSDKQPNDAHRALAELERRGFVDAVVTQNIDRLHRRAGSAEVIEVHGSIETSSCVDCRSSWPLEEVEALFADGVARCTDCSGKVKPDVVLFGEFLPEEPMFRARQLAESADLIFCIGTSLEVYPVAGLPELTLSNGGRLAILTKGPTPYDAEADLRLDGDVVTELTALLAALG
jgi:NAD-dependent deacetylase